MKRHRFYCNPINTDTAELIGADVRHLSKVLRLGPGDTVDLFDGTGCIADAVGVDLEKFAPIHP